MKFSKHIFTLLLFFITIIPLILLNIINPPTIQTDKLNNSLEEIKVMIYKSYFYLNPNNLENNLNTNAANLVLNKDPQKTEFWLKVAGIEKNIKSFKKISQTQNITLCHKNAHILGTKSYEVYKNEAFFFYSEWCASGFIHGVMEAYLRENGFEIDEIKNICNSLNTTLKKGECFHGVGHGLMSYENYDLPKAIKDCKDLNVSDLFNNACADGVFMENKIANSGGSNQVHSTSWVNNDPLFPCNAVDQSDLVQNACWTNQVTILLNLYQNDLPKVISVCSSLENKKSQSTCFYGIGLQLSFLIKSTDPQKLFDACQNTKSGENSCLNGVLKYYVKFYSSNLSDQPIKLCNFVQNSDNKKLCYQNFGRHLSLQNSDKPEFIKKICSYSEKDYENFCLRRE